MLNGKHVLIVASNQLLCVGLKTILLESFSPERVTIADAFDTVKHNHQPDYVFLSPDMYVVHQSHLQPLRHRVVILTEKEADTSKQEGPMMLNITLRQPELIDRLEEIFHQDEKSAASAAQENLTSREVEVLVLVARGFINKQIADKLSISLHTVISHRKNITQKLGIKTVAGLTMYALLNGLISSKDIR